jgi:putative DNA primase/helicase
MLNWHREDMVVKMRNKAATKAIELAIRKKNDATVKQLSDDIVEAPAAPVRRRLVTTDATVEKLAMLLQDNPNGMLVLRDELVGWLKDMDKPGRESTRAFFLECWSGDGKFTVDRVTRETVFVNGLCLSILGCCVPGTYVSYVSEALEDGRGADGLLQRFQLAVWPDISKEWTDVDRWPNHQARAEAGDCYRMLDNLAPARVGAETDPYSGTSFLRFDEQAQSCWNEWYADVQNRARRSDFTAWQSYLGKLPKTVAGLALLCHLLNGSAGPVAKDATLQALAWSEFLEGHAKRIYLSGTVRQTAAQILLQHIKAGDVVTGDTLRNVQRHEWSRLDTAEAVNEAVIDLTEAGYIRMVSKKDTGGAPAKVITVNPKLEVSGNEDYVARQLENESSAHGRN